MLLRDIDKASSIQEAIAAHDRYLNSIQRQCLVVPDKLWTLISGRILSVLALAVQLQNFSWRVSRLDENPADLEMDLGGLQDSFYDANRFLNQVITSKLKVGNSRSIQHLALMLDYNQFYASSNSYNI